MSPRLKYFFFQLPGWAIAAAVLITLTRFELLPSWLAGACFAAWIIKDLVLYPLLRRAYEPGITGSARLVGALGIAEGDLAPRGYVRVRGELWRAVATPGDVMLKSGTEVEVVKADRMELIVRRNDVWSRQADRDAAKSQAHD